MKTVLVVAGLILKGSDQVLLAQRPPDKALAGLWEFPGGKVESEENEEQALHRELSEELNLQVQITHHLGHFPHTYDWGNLILSVFVVRPLNEPSASQDVHVFRWETWQRVQEAELAPADIEPWREFLRRFGTTG